MSTTAINNNNYMQLTCCSGDAIIQWWGGDISTNKLEQMAVMKHFQASHDKSFWELTGKLEIQKKFDSNYVYQVSALIPQMFVLI